MKVPNPLSLYHFKKQVSYRLGLTLVYCFIDVGKGHGNYLLFHLVALGSEGCRHGSSNKATLPVAACRCSTASFKPVWLFQTSLEGAVLSESEYERLVRCARQADVHQMWYVAVGCK